MSKRNDYYQRLSKFLAYSGVASRRQSESLILSGKITVNGVTVTSLTLKVTEKDIICFNGKRILNNLKPRIWIYNKPVGELCSDFDPSGKKTVFESIPKKIGKICLVGRLDLNSEGLLLLTNKGYIKRYLELPKNKIIRAYLVKAWGRELTKKNLEEIRSGIEISQFQYAPMEINLISKKRNSFWYNFKLIEGKNREIRNVLGHFGLKVKKLIRISYGEFLLNNQKSGEVLEVPIPQSLLKSAENG